MSEQQQIRIGDVENKLDGVGVFYLFTSIISFIVLILLSQGEPIKLSGLSYIMLVLGFVSLAQGIIFWILFKAGAEVIRLLKKLNGLPYGGVISGSNNFDTEYKCTACGAPVTQEAKYCTQCGGSFEKQQETK